MAFVLDCSVCIAWFMPDERMGSSRTLLDRVVTDRVWVPGHWPLEVANTFLTAERRGRVTRAQRDAALGHVSRLPIAVDDATAEMAWSRSLDIADRHGLTIYDAAYLELALRRALPLATLDGALGAAAVAVGTALLPA